MATSRKSWDNIEAPGRSFLKMQGLRNHFVIVDGRNESYNPDTREVVNICDPQTGVGADQLVIIEQPHADEAHAFMRLVNVDGRDVEACGNATRCVAWLLMEEAGTDTISIETLAGVLECHRKGDMRVSCDMGKISMEWQYIPLAREQDTLHMNIESGSLRDPVGLSIGNPHAVFFVDDLDAVDLKALAPAIQKNDLFPNEVNVGAAQIIDSKNMRLVVYERGAGLTTACGSGACAAVYAARARGLTESNRVTVSMPAGSVDIDIGADDHALMTGPVAFAFKGCLPKR
jgi:diaminopimelate epimerase